MLGNTRLHLRNAQWVYGPPPPAANQFLSLTSWPLKILTMNRRNFLAAGAGAALAGTLSPPAVAQPSPVARDAFLDAARACLAEIDVLQQHRRVLGQPACHAVAQVQAVLQGAPVLSAASDPVYLGMLASLSARVCANAARECAEHPDHARVAAACQAVSEAAWGYGAS